MNIREIKTPITAAMLNESLAKRYGSKIDVSKFSLVQLEDARNKVRTMLKDIETNESFNAVASESYQKSKLFLDVLNQAIKEAPEPMIEAEAEVVTEGAEDNAELVMASKDMVDRVTGWMEDTAEMQTESMLELADAIRDEMGSEKSEAFTASIKPALEAMYGVMETTRVTLTQGVGMLTGEGDAPMMGAPDEEPAMEPTVDGGEIMPDPELDGVDEFGAAEPAAGGEDEAGRAKRESVQRSKKKLAERSRRLATTLSKKK